MTKQITCDAPNCEFQVEAGTADEAARHARQHAKEYHNAELSLRDATEMIREV